MYCLSVELPIVTCFLIFWSALRVQGHAVCVRCLQLLCNHIRVNLDGFYSPWIAFIFVSKTAFKSKQFHAYTQWLIKMRIKLNSLSQVFTTVKSTYHKNEANLRSTREKNFPYVYEGVIVLRPSTNTALKSWKRLGYYMLFPLLFFFFF